MPLCPLEAPRHRLSATIPTLLVSSLQRLHQGCKKRLHVHYPMVRANETLKSLAAFCSPVSIVGERKAAPEHFR
jgi:hypothetical protein